MTRAATRAIIGLAACLAFGAAAPAHAASAYAASAYAATQDSVSAAPPTAVTATVTPPAARAIYDGTMSPYCPGLLLASCPSPQADSLRRAIARRAAAGESEASILADLAATYGDVIRASPERTGFGLVAWLAPFCAVVAGGLLVRRFLGRSLGRATAPGIASVEHAARAGQRVEQRGHADEAFADDATPEERAALDELLRRG